MGIETWNKFPHVLEKYGSQGVPLPCSDQHPRLPCKETRWARDFCLNSGGSCEYKIEAHFDCLEQHYPREKVDILRKNFRPSIMDIPTSDVYVRYRHYFASNPQHAGKSAWNNIF